MTLRFASWCRRLDAVGLFDLVTLLMHTSSALLLLKSVLLHLGMPAQRQGLAFQFGLSAPSREVQLSSNQLGNRGFQWPRPSSLSKAEPSGRFLNLYILLRMSLRAHQDVLLLSAYKSAKRGRSHFKCAVIAFAAILPSTQLPLALL